MVSKAMNRIGEKEREYLKDVLNTQFKSSSGATYMRKLEKAFARRYQSAFAISCINGTATMHAALEAMGVGFGDEVIVTPLTMSATTFAVLQANATPVFADVDLDTFQICPISIEQKITSKTKAIITVALYGLSPDMDRVMDLAKKHGLQVIEDNAECFLGEYKGRLAGTLGHCASFSFQSSKHLTSGEGGMILTDDVDLAEEIRKVQSLGYAGVGAKTAKISKSDIQNPDYSRHVSMGWNYRMPELCCAVALAQVENIDNLVSVRIKSAQFFEDATKEFHSWFRPQHVGPDYKNSYWTWVCKNLHDTASWLDIRDAFVSKGGDGVYGAWKLTYLEPMFANMNLLGRQDFINEKNINMYKSGLCPNAEYLQGRLFQFKTNYWNLDDAEKQAEILHKTLIEFN